MQATKNPHQLRVLHVLTLNGRNGEYGGPVRVARELCAELNSRGHSTHILSGALEGSEPSPKPGLFESYAIVRPVTGKLAFSSLWSWKLVRLLNQSIKNSDIVHVHFARDLIPFLSAFISIVRKKPFVCQTHGMISEHRLSTRIIDLFITKPLINKSQTVLALTEVELEALQQMGVKPDVKVLPNGIAVELNREVLKFAPKRVAFCSRLDKRKGVEKFVKLADAYSQSETRFEIYGPDGGELEFIKREIEAKELKEVLEYKGALQAQEVQELLSEIDLLVLPSRDDNFPMVILEALAVGTPVLVMPSCGFADALKIFEPNFVASSEDLSGLFNSFEKQQASNYSDKSQKEIIEFCSQQFGISSVTDQLLITYKEAFDDAS
jgi:glycosyltransferase involved in cell wall biosynthesis